MSQYMNTTLENFEDLRVRVRFVIDTRDEKTLSIAFSDWPDLDEFTKEPRHYGKFSKWSHALKLEAISTMESFLSRF